MRLYVTIPILLLGVGCQSGGRLAPCGDGSPSCGCGATSTVSAISPVKGSSGVMPANASLALGPEGNATTEPMTADPPPGPAPAAGPTCTPVPCRVQTTTTYRRQCDLSMDYVPIHIPFPHLRIFQGPDKVVTQTEYVHVAVAPQTPPAPAPAEPPALPKRSVVAPPLAPMPSVVAPPAAIPPPVAAAPPGTSLPIVIGPLPKAQRPAGQQLAEPSAPSNNPQAQVPKRLPQFERPATLPPAPAAPPVAEETSGGTGTRVMPAPLTLPAMPSPRIPSSLPAATQIDVGER